MHVIPCIITPVNDVVDRFATYQMPIYVIGDFSVRYDWLIDIYRIWIGASVTKLWMKVHEMQKMGWFWVVKGDWGS